MDRMFELFARGSAPEEKLAGLPEPLQEDELVLFGKFNRFLRELVDFREKLRRNYTLSGWMKLLQSGLEEFFCGSDTDSSGEIAMLNRFFNDKRVKRGRL